MHCNMRDILRQVVKQQAGLVIHGVWDSVPSCPGLHTYQNYTDVEWPVELHVKIYFK